MRSLMPDLLNLLDQGVGIFDVSTLELIECNETLFNWFNLNKNNRLLSDHITNKDLSRLQKSISKNRIFRFKMQVYIQSRCEYVDFKTQISQLSDKVDYLIIQGSINNYEHENQRLIKEYSIINEKIEP